jgi:hypothetical protein
VSDPTSQDSGEQSFADVLNSLSSGPWGASGTDRRPGGAPAQPPSPAGGLPPVQPVATPPDEWREPAEPASVVRPYTWTRGRTAPVLDLAVETLVSTSEKLADPAMLPSEEYRAIAELCRDPRSVAEVAALLSLPLGVARVLLADLADNGLVVVHRNAKSPGDRPDMALMERVLSGLRRL